MQNGNTGWAGGARQWGEARIVGDDAEAPEGACTTLPRPKGLEKATPFQSNCAAPTPPATSQAWDFCSDTQKQPYCPHQAGWKMESFLWGIKLCAETQGRFWWSSDLVCLECDISVEEK